jgi:hypothetical protein
MGPDDVRGNDEILDRSGRVDLYPFHDLQQVSLGVTDSGTPRQGPGLGQASPGGGAVSGRTDVSLHPVDFSSSGILGDQVRRNEEDGNQERQTEG